MKSNSSKNTKFFFLEYFNSFFHFPQAILSMALLTLLIIFIFRQIQDYRLLKKEDYYIRALGKELCKYDVPSQNA